MLDADLDSSPVLLFELTASASGVKGDYKHLPSHGCQLLDNYRVVILVL